MAFIYFKKQAQGFRIGGRDTMLKRYRSSKSIWILYGVAIISQALAKASE
jgi:hypothetical protein